MPALRLQVSRTVFVIDDSVLPVFLTGAALISQGMAFDSQGEKASTDERRLNQALIQGANGRHGRLF